MTDDELRAAASLYRHSCTHRASNEAEVDAERMEAYIAGYRARDPECERLLSGSEQYEWALIGQEAETARLRAALERIEEIGNDEVWGFRQIAREALQPQSDAGEEQ